VKRVLFRPFDLSKWFVIGFGAWLAFLGERGSGFNGSFNWQKRRQINLEDVRRAVTKTQDFVLANLHWIIPVAVVAFSFVLVLTVVFAWLRSRGQFIFLDCVINDQARIAEPWRKYAPEANSLFWFRLVLSIAGMALMFPLVGYVLLWAYRALMAEHCGELAPLIVSVSVMVLLSLILFLAVKFTVDFVVPLMFLRRTRCVAAWCEFLRLLGAYPGEWILYLLFQIVLTLAIVVVVFAAIIATCCIAGCLMILPYIGAVVLLPVLVFKRSYSIYFLSQFAPEYEALAPANEVPPVSPPLLEVPVVPAPPPPIADPGEPEKLPPNPPVENP